MLGTSTILNTQPADFSPIPAPKITFTKVAPKKPSFPTGGIKSTGNIRFSANNATMVNLAREAFLEFSNHKESEQALSYFLHSLSITSNFEGGFDAINTYDIAGVSIGFLQFARPEGGAGRLLDLAGRSDLAQIVRTRFGTKDNHDSAEAIKARFDTDLLKELVVAVTTPQGIKAQFAMAVNQNVDGQLYFEKAYSKFLELKLQAPLSCSFLFDCAINMGVGSLKHFPPCSDGDNNWITACIPLLKRPERVTGWKKLLSSNIA